MGVPIPSLCFDMTHLLLHRYICSQGILKGAENSRIALVTMANSYSFITAFSLPLGLLILISYLSSIYYIYPILSYYIIITFEFSVST